MKAPALVNCTQTFDICAFKTILSWYSLSTWPALGSGWVLGWGSVIQVIYSCTEKVRLTSFLTHLGHLVLTVPCKAGRSAQSPSQRGNMIYHKSLSQRDDGARMWAWVWLTGSPHSFPHVPGHLTLVTGALGESGRVRIAFRLDHLCTKAWIPAKSI